MRDVEVIEAELSEISAIQDDFTRFERIIAWCADHPREIPLALRFFSGRTQGIEEWVRKHSESERRD